MMSLLNGLFGCPHKRTTFPRTRLCADGVQKVTYMVCLNCAKEIPYNWTSMRVGSVPVPQPTTELPSRL